MDALRSRKMRLLGLEFDDMNCGQAAFFLLARRADAPFAYVTTPNADHLQRLHNNPAMRATYAASLLCLLDSRAISRLATRLGQCVPPVVTGADLSATLLPRLAGRRVAIVGMAPAVIDALATRYPGIAFCHHQPPMGLLYDKPAFARAQQFIEDSGAEISFIALGSPVQEILAYRIAQRGRATGLGLCVGGALEFCAGTRPRAPLFLRKWGLEWAWRLFHEPLRLAPRYLLHDPPVLLRLIS